MLNDSIFKRIDELRLPLINRFYASCNYNVKCGRHDRVFSLTQQGKIIAAARLMPHPQGHFLLRNLCVEPEARNQGVATHLLTKILAELAPMNSKVACYCYALPHLQEFYLALGFKYLTIEQVPQDIAETHLRNCARKRGWILMGYSNNLYNDGHKQN
ncbi:MAG TPA: GNAT family N-acetyltransferase [Cellvibrio sp.]|nr:GNAT family N-acetyltransferase [Cellvibrio sp.]